MVVSSTSVFTLNKVGVRAVVELLRVILNKCKCATSGKASGIKIILCSH